MEWELAKENVQPLREGRNVEKLNAALKARTTASGKSIISKQHRKMVEAIDDYDGEDPLEPWLQCIWWVKEAYPSGGSQSGLLKLLELCVRTFWRDERYQNDIRYLKVWIEYADRCRDPREIYIFLQNNNIGQNHTLFYEAYAKYLEHQQNLRKANDILQIGISRKAQPIERLQDAYVNFLKRCAIQAADDTPKDDASGVLIDAERIFASNITNFPYYQVSGQLSHLTLKQKTARTQRCVSGPNCRGLSVFVDPEFRSNSASSHFNENSWGLKTTRNRKMFVPESEKSKENTQLPMQWVDIKIPQETKEEVPQLDVFIDDEFSRINIAGEEGQTSLKRTAPASLRLRLDDIHGYQREVDRLKQSPLIHFMEDAADIS